MSTQPSSGKEPWLAVILSSFFPGIGQIYSGKTFRGLAFIIAHICLLFLGGWLLLSSTGNTRIGLIFLLTGGILVPVWGLFDAHRCARKVNNANFERLRKSNKDPWLAVFLSNIMLGLGHLYIGKWLLGISLIVILIGLYIIPFGTIIKFILLPFVAYNGYMSAPVRRENSKNLIKIICVILFVIPVLLPGGIALSVRTYIAEARYIASGSMLPTLQINDRLIIDKLVYRFQEPQRGDIILFNPTETLQKQNFLDAFISRVIGLPGEKVELREGKVYINDRLLQEKYVEEGQLTVVDVCPVGLAAYLSKPVIVPPNSYLTLGDNRRNSYDGRCWGVVQRDLIIGKATKRFWPSDRMGSLE